jgi:surface antigen
MRKINPTPRPDAVRLKSAGRRGKDHAGAIHPVVDMIKARHFAAIAALLPAACISAPEPPAVAAAPSGPPPITGWLAGPAGRDLPPSDLERAAAAERTAAETGRRASWRGTGGNFGVVEPGADSAGGACRAFTHVIYLDGRAQRGGGAACRNASGAWIVNA